MFSLCLRIPRAAGIRERRARALSPSIRKVKGRKVRAIMEDRETILVMKKVPKNGTASIRITNGFRARIKPSVDATPFPPLKERNIEKSCPTTPKRPAKNNSAVDKPRYFPIITGIKPFDISRTPDTRPNFKPRTLETLVAPMFPLPIFLISIPLIILTNINPNGILP